MSSRPKRERRLQVLANPHVLLGPVGDGEQAGAGDVGLDPLGGAEGLDVREGLDHRRVHPAGRGRTHLADQVVEAPGHHGHGEAAVAAAGAEPDRLALQDHDAPARLQLGEADRRPEAGEAPSDDDDVRLLVALQRKTRGLGKARRGTLLPPARELTASSRRRATSACGCAPIDAATASVHGRMVRQGCGRSRFRRHAGPGLREALLGKLRSHHAEISRGAAPGAAGRRRRQVRGDANAPGRTYRPSRVSCHPPIDLRTLS